MTHHPHTRGNGEGAFGTHRDPNPIEVAEKELLTGELHEAWHGDQEPVKPYTDPILAKARQAEREAGRGGQTPSQGKDKGIERER